MENDSVAIALGSYVVECMPHHSLSTRDCLLVDIIVVVTLAVVALIVIVVVRLQVDVIQHHAKDLRAYVLKQLPRTPYDVAGTLSAVDYQ